MRYNRKSHHKRLQQADAIVAAPLNDSLTPEERLKSCLELSELVSRMATFVICHVIVDYQDLLKDERTSVASAFLQRVTSTHLSNHKLTKEGIEFRYRGEVFHLHEEYKTMTLTRSVYEHLAIFYFLYVHPKTEDERNTAWNNWKANNKDKEESWRVSYSQAWKYLFKKKEMAQLYNHLSMHCHPVYNGLLQYQSQSVTDEGYDGVPLYLSCCFLAYLCRLFLRLIPDGNKLLSQEFSEQERKVFNALSQMSDD